MYYKHCLFQQSNIVLAKIRKSKKSNKPIDTDHTTSVTDLMTNKGTNRWTKKVIEMMLRI